ncbi:hypothetical protein SRABI83_03898 [Arthrobacter sp. Bi83]|jgi:hypothetical protein|nr:hypothetical protein SRABI83_03898 [Arthrobacter sp. Bi83]
MDNKRQRRRLGRAIRADVRDEIKVGQAPKKARAARLQEIRDKRYRARPNTLVDWTLCGDRFETTRAPTPMPGAPS